MRNEPKLIWLQLGEDGDLMANDDFMDLVRGNDYGGVTWCWHAIDDHDIAYILLRDYAHVIRELVKFHKFSLFQAYEPEHGPPTTILRAPNGLAVASVPWEAIQLIQNQPEVKLESELD